MSITYNSILSFILHSRKCKFRITADFLANLGIRPASFPRKALSKLTAPSGTTNKPLPKEVKHLSQSFTDQLPNIHNQPKIKIPQQSLVSLHKERKLESIAKS